MCKKLCFPCRAFAECMRKTVVPIIVLTWVNFGFCTLAAWSPFWVSQGNNRADGPLIICEDRNGTLLDSFECYFRDLSDQSGLMVGASWTILLAFIGFFACGVLGSLLNCACFEASRVCFIGVIIVTTIVSGILCFCCLVLYSVEYGDIFSGTSFDQIYDWGYYMCLVECVIVIPSAIIYTVFCACCGVCWTCQGALCCCC